MSRMDENPLHSALEALSRAGWSPRKLANHLGIAERTMARAVRGDWPLPEAAMDWLAYLTEPTANRAPSRDVINARLSAQPLPDGWNTGDLPLTPRARPAQPGQKGPETPQPVGG